MNPNINLNYHVTFVRTDLQTMKLENDNLLMEKSELTLRLNQAKTDGLEKEIRLNNELQRVKLELRQKEDLLKVKVDEMDKSKDEMLMMMEVYTIFIQIYKLSLSRKYQAW